MATFSWDVNRFRVLLDMGKPSLEIVPYSSKRFVPLRLKQDNRAFVPTAESCLISTRRRID